MDLLTLTYFQRVARLQHLSRAAQELHVAQPSLSRSIARLERQLGLKLFDRRQGMRLNDNGRLLLWHADRILGDVREAEVAMSQLRSGEVGSLTVAAETMLTLTATVQHYRARHPQVAVQLRQADALEMVGLLRAADVELCVASQELSSTELESRLLLREPVLLAMPVGHPLSGRERVGIAEVAGDGWVTTKPGQWQRALLDRLLTAEGLRPRIACEIDEPGASQDLVAAGAGIGLIPQMARRADTRAEVAWATLDAPEAVRELRLVWRRDRRLSAAAEQFGEQLVRDLVPPAAPGG